MIRKIFTRLYDQRKTIKRLIMIWTNDVWTLLQVEMHVLSDYPLWSSTERAYSFRPKSGLPHMWQNSIFHHHYNTDGKKERIRYNRYTLKDRYQQTFCKILYVHVRANRHAKKPRVCFEENLACTNLCFCQGSEWCKHAQTHTLREDTS